MRGTGYDFLRNDAFDAPNFFVRKTVQPDGTLLKDPVPPLDRHQFAGAIGGAVVIPGSMTATAARFSSPTTPGSGSGAA